MSHRPRSAPPPYNASSPWELPQYQDNLHPQLSYQSTQYQVYQPTHHQAPTYQYYVPTTPVKTVPVSPSPGPSQSYQPQPTYVTNYIYQTPPGVDPVKIAEPSREFDSSAPSYQPQPTYVTNHIYQVPVVDPVKIAEPPKEFDWIPAVASTASHLTGRAVIGGHEADGSPLWVIRSKVIGGLIPGKFTVRDNTASIPYLGVEKKVESIEILCIRPENLQWVSAQNGQVPPNAIEAGKTKFGHTLYVGRVPHRQTLTPGYVGKRHQCCVIGFGGTTVSIHSYEVLCRV